MPVNLYEDSNSHVGIGFYHPNEKEKLVMEELMECFAKEPGFKQITQEMQTPPLAIDTFHERPFYSEWVIGLSSVFFFFILIGCAIEIYKYITRPSRKTIIANLELQERSQLMESPRLSGILEK